jgi:hypothetical protein
MARDDSNQHLDSVPAYDPRNAVNVSSPGCTRRVLGTIYEGDGPTDKPRYECAFPGCTQDFGREKDLRRHAGAIHDGTRVACPVCGYHFSRSDNMRRHARNAHRIHGDEQIDD